MSENNRLCFFVNFCGGKQLEVIMDHRRTGTHRLIQKQVQRTEQLKKTFLKPSSLKLTVYNNNVSCFILYKLEERRNFERG